MLEPLSSGHLMIKPRIGDAAKELCGQLIEINESESKITAQIKTKIILLQFIFEMWNKGYIIENDISGRNTVEKEMLSYIQQNFSGKISLKEFGERFHLSENIYLDILKSISILRCRSMLLIYGWSMRNSFYKTLISRLRR